MDETRAYHQNACQRVTVNKYSLMKLEPIIQSEVSQKEKHQYSILKHIYGIWKHGNDDPQCETAKETKI